MFKLEQQDSGFDERIGEMLKKLAQFPTDMSDEYFNWEAEDLHRKHPWVARKRKSRRKAVAFTYLTQHSIARMKRSYAHRKALRAEGRRVRRKSTRPILRETLWAKFVIRMQNLLEQKIHW